MTKESLGNNTTKKERTWLLPDFDGRDLAAGLYLVATPIGNLRDISLRALDTLAAADVIVCEDTRVSKKLLSYYGLRGTLMSYNDHSDDQKREKVLRHVADGQVVVLISDAGMPLISDPGYKLVREALERGLYVTSVPGANAPLAALQLSGLPSDKFSFIGFLPPKQGAREKLLTAWQGTPGTLVAFETAPRLLAALESVRAVFGDVSVAVVREITKLYEESLRGSASELISYYEEEGLPKGEIVLLIGYEEKACSEEEIEALLVKALKNKGTKEAAAHVASLTGRPKKELYDLALKISRDE